MLDKATFAGEKKKVAIINLMPTKERTETQLLRVLSHAKDNIDITLVMTSTYTPTHVSKEYLDSFYKPFYDIKDEYFDGLIITGAPLDNIAYEDVAYWQEFLKMIEFAKTHVKNTITICWGAFAYLYAEYKVGRYLLDDKLFGVYKATKICKDERLLDGLDDEFLVPVSRHLTLYDDMVRESTKVLATFDNGRTTIARTNDGKVFFFFGHSEYDKYTLYDEYMRDVNKGLPIKKPINYFVENDIERIDYSWHKDAITLFTNWANNYI